jgi:hypothetical protein
VQLVIKEKKMKLNHECVRALLLYLEENLMYKANGNPEGVKLKYIDDEPDISNFSTDEIYYSAKKLVEAKYIKVMDSKLPTRSWKIEEITFNGHDYLDSIRDDKVWNEVIERTKPFASVGIDIVKSLSTKILTEMLLK